MDIKEIKKSIETWLSEGTDRHAYFIAIEDPSNEEKLKFSTAYGGNMKAVAATMIGISLGREEFAQVTGELYDTLTAMLHSCDGALSEKGNKTIDKKLS